MFSAPKPRAKDGSNSCHWTSLRPKIRALRTDVARHPTPSTVQPLSPLELVTMQRLRTSGTLWVFPRPPVRPRGAGSPSRLSTAVARRPPNAPAEPLFSHLPVRGNTDWTPQRLTWVGACMGWDEGQTLAARRD